VSSRSASGNQPTRREAEPETRIARSCRCDARAERLETCVVRALSVSRARGRR
jgi:hypothetical protein